ncbi:hypothetical protein SAMN05414139_00019 [Burkholderia sp. D7]|nr:hypothetical protein SAMN05414139_00019 [Burkholderia sp. D7]
MMAAMATGTGVAVSRDGYVSMPRLLAREALK